MMIQYCHEATMNATGGFQIFFSLLLDHSHTRSANPPVD